ncbi:ribosome maturation factor RimM [Pseudoxanthomonas jiangsuensis]|uniref:ribosome maturation factor RimM n=1 Tax=Pseudoxanthomonas jiangsuensis TaxID=619688 RepID=UPI0013919FB7|nr:ribosome maturation factor RimM [Pseudoxanthomonas jiangsuensis]KAF1691294.1 ribosome maturation factor RimM [Pseudoxanthomonas jiangsuensis]
MNEDAGRPTPPQEPRKLILMGRVTGAFGVRGDVKIESWTEPRAQIFRYQPWTLRAANGIERELSGARGRDTGKHVVATLPGCEDRDAAEALRGTEIWVPREVLPPPAPGEYYWVDLEGLRVVTVDGVALGEVSHLLSTGANDVMVVRGERERMLPFVQPDYVRSVDFDSGTITVDWDPEF